MTWLTGFRVGTLTLDSHHQIPQPPPMLALQIVPIVLATVAITLTLWQFFTSHRPFVGISGARLVRVERDLGTSAPGLQIGSVITFKNWGTIQANEINTSVRLAMVPEGIAAAPWRHRNFPELLPRDHIRPLCERYHLAAT